MKTKTYRGTPEFEVECTQVKSLWDKGFTIKEIGIETGLKSFVLGKRLDHLGISAKERHRRSLAKLSGNNNSRFREDISTNEIIKMYFEDKMSSNDIAKKFNCTYGLITYRLKKLGLKLRSDSEAHKLKPNRYWLGKNLPQEMIAKTIETRRIRDLENPEGRNKKPADFGRNMSGSNNPFYGKHHTEETRKLIKERTPRLFGKDNPFYGKKHSSETRKVIKEKRALQVTPTKDTKIEVKVQEFLKILGIDFMTHQHIKNIEHVYQCDIFVPSMNLIIECDGDYWHSYPTGNEIDHVRTSELLQKGFKVLRLWECEVKKMDVKGFKEKLK